MRYEKLRPDVIRVMGRDFYVKYYGDSPLGHANLGICQNHQFEIHVLATVHPVEEADTLLHELLHAIWYTMSIDCGGPMEEEPIVRRLSTGLIGVFLDNPHLLKYFQAIHKAAEEGK